MIGVVKIKDGLFICDEFGAQVSWVPLHLELCHHLVFRSFSSLFSLRLKTDYFLGSRVRCGEQSHPSCKYSWDSIAQFLGSYWGLVPHSQLARRRKADFVWLGWENTRWNLQIHWRSNWKPWERANLISKGLEPRLFCHRDLHYEEIQMEHHENSGVPQLSPSWTRNETKFPAPNSNVWKQTSC